MRFDIITGKPPETVTIDGKQYPINHDFRIGVKLDAILCSEKTNAEKFEEMINLYYPVIPRNLEEAYKQILWFYNGGKEEVKEEKKRYERKASKEPAYSFSQDAPYIYAAFKEQYGIDLSEESYMHWWKFLALFESLGEDTKIAKIMYYRKVRTSGMSKDKRAFINEMKKIYQLNQNVMKLTLEERNQRWKNYVKERYKTG